MKIEHLFSQSCLKCVYKLKKCQLPKYFSSLHWVPRSSIHDHDTRSACSIDTIYTCTHMASKCTRSQLPSLLNNTPDIILSKINTHSIQGFSFFLSDIIYHNIWLIAKKGNVLYLPYIPPMLDCDIASRHVVNAAVMISTYIINYHFSSSSFQKFIVSPSPLRFYHTQDLVNFERRLRQH